jgi:lipoate-protein ligase A/biotin synthase-related radical SAM superfamily protein
MAVVGGRRGRPGSGPAAGDLPTTAYFMEGERCSRDCAFCPQARTASARGDLLARVNWPRVGEQDETGFWEGLRRAVADGQLRRACFQVTATPSVMEAVEADVRRLQASCPDLPICVSVAARDLDEIQRVLGWGTQRVTLALDAATPDTYQATKGGDSGPRLALLREAAERFPGRIGTHLIAGLGETEREMVLAIQAMTDLGVAVALFAFTPVPGTALEDRQPPDLQAYRRLQAAHFLVTRGLARGGDMSFDSRGRVVSYGRTWGEVAARLAGQPWGPGEAAEADEPGAQPARACEPGLAFRTSGCPDCNRPYYNERPSGPLYNYPRPLSAGEVSGAVESARPMETDPCDRWRLIVEVEPRSGAWNMAVDEALLLEHAAGGTPPTLRLYRWDPPAVSLGYFQDPATEVDQAACRSLGIAVVRRPTGGRAVLHDREVTYSVVVGGRRLPGSVVETYRRLAEGLVLGLRALGARAVLAPEKAAREKATPERATPEGSGPALGACFEVPSSYEIIVGGRKVVGSAQVRRKGVILQHGSIPLVLDADRLARVLGFPPAAAARIRAKATGLKDVLGEGAPSYEEVCRAVAEGLASALGIVFEPGRLKPEETALAERLVREKYGLEAWNLKRPESRPDSEKEDD